MATPNFGTTKQLSSSNCGVIPSVPGGGFPKIIGAYIYYTGSAWAVDSGKYSAEIVSGDLAWDTDHLVITTAGYSALPIAIAGIWGDESIYICSAEAVDNSGTYEIHITFRNSSGTLISTEDTSMKLSIIIWGN